VNDAAVTFFFSFLSGGLSFPDHDEVIIRKDNAIFQYHSETGAKFIASVSTGQYSSADHCWPDL